MEFDGIGGEHAAFGTLAWTVCWDARDDETSSKRAWRISAAGDAP